MAAYGTSIFLDIFFITGFCIILSLPIFFHELISVESPGVPYMPGACGCSLTNRDVNLVAGILCVGISDIEQRVCLWLWEVGGCYLDAVSCGEVDGHGV